MAIPAERSILRVEYIINAYCALQDTRYAQLSCTQFDAKTIAVVDHANL
jgi:hypothetical protein